MALPPLIRRETDDVIAYLDAATSCPAAPSPWTPRWCCQLAAGHEGWHQALTAPGTHLVEWATKGA